jgi:hypothetical protein
MNRECTRYDGGSIRKFCKGGEVNSPLPNLYHRPLALVLVTLIGTLPLIRFLGLRTVSDEVIRTPTIETAISAASLLDLLNIWPGPSLLWLLQRHGDRRLSPDLPRGTVNLIGGELDVDDPRLQTNRTPQSLHHCSVGYHPCHMNDLATKAYPCKRNLEQSNRLDYEMGSHKPMNGDTV